MSGSAPRLVSNEAGVVAPNSLLSVRLRPGKKVSAKALAVLWQTSLTRLSCEIEGHSMGGGMLKVEPGEAERVLVPLWQGSADQLEILGLHVDGLLRSGREREATATADQEILGNGLGLSPAEIEVLGEAASTLRDRRYRKGL
jgi:hypothetical protein